MRLTSPLGRAIIGDVTKPLILSSSSGNVEENAALSFTLTASEPVTFTLSGGADVALFEIVQPVTPSLTATLRFDSDGTKDFETPDDANTDNAYVTGIRATDPRGNYAEQTVTITVTNVLEVTLNTLTIDDDEIEEGSVATDVVGTLSGASSGSTLSLTVNPGGLFDLDGNDLVVTGDPGAVDTEYEITVRETHPDATNSPNDTPFTITVVSAEPTVGPELHPQPDFNASTGLTLTSLGDYGPEVPTVAGGVLTLKSRDDGEEGSHGSRCRATALETIVAGTVRVSGTVDSIAANLQLAIFVGGTEATTITTSGAFSEDFATAAASQLIDINCIPLGGAEGDIVLSDFHCNQIT